MVIVDDHVYEWARCLNLHLYSRKGKSYVINNDGKRLHRMILNVDNPAEVVDHKNGNTLDNRIDNLRVCLQRDNSRNRIKAKGEFTSRFKGVHWHRGWVAQIRVNYRKIHLGTFKTEFEAAKAYNEAALLHFGVFANLNAVQDTMASNRYTPAVSTAGLSKDFHGRF